jgi:hypothetical protein
MTTTQDPHPTLVSAVRYLAGHCDGAQTEDGVGYNGTDTHFGRALAQVHPSAWCASHVVEATRMVRKYRNQLAGGGINVDEVPSCEDEATGSRTLRIVDFDPDTGLFLLLPYNDAYDPRGLGARWDRSRKRWAIPTRSAGDVLEVAEYWGLGVSDVARAFCENPPEVGPEPPAGTIDVDDEMFVIRFDYSRRLVDAVKEIPGRRWNGGEKYWVAPLTSVRPVKTFAEQHNFTLTAAAADVPDAEVDTNPVIEVVGGAFRIRFPYDRDMVARVRDIPTARWNASVYLWEVDLDAAVEVTEFAIACGARIGSSAQGAMNEARAAIARIEASAAHDADLDIPGLGGELLPFQRAGVAYALHALGRSMAMQPS